MRTPSAGMVGNLATPRNRVGLVVALCLVVVAGLASRRFGPLLPEFIASHAGDALWTVAVFVTLAICRPGASPLAVGAAAFGI